MAEQNMATMQKGQLCWWATLVVTMAVFAFISSANADLGGRHTWERPGCHLLGHTRKVTIPECVDFTITTNACRGYCESFAVPSAWYRLQNNPSQSITSVGQCCSIMETEDVTVNVICVDGPRELVFKSAKSCSCYHCKKD
ncbi:thyrostimulin alpha-2 subunit [Folsomia candida]|uniref:thyrostimulin alpha-2 subunit n=1 Tax=Folsomia candida TaxID=158441 RepID=UPI000B8EF092|nr:thyrostimulin alpha-2 subunit [Folsomia candida]XP_021949001.1 thyrostimulin alpha-2 subunit [Folsomia candida]XP_035706007.1 thyrostimulin alpha-2 subunit [Folsomia candida]XP_035706008.1 thyrostimulin alpha-2 subunit [Folsomia candida]